MNKNLYWSYSLGVFLFLGLFANPAFAEVESITVDSNLYDIDKQIKISGTVEDDSTGVVTIMIRDQNNDFVLLTHSEIRHDGSFGKKIDVKDQLIEHEMYSVTGFIFSITDAETVKFVISSEGISTHDVVKSNKMTTGQITDDNFISDSDQNRYAEALEPSQNVKQVSFLDSDKDPRYYIERYYSEPHYKSWFDRNYPGQTIEEAVGHHDNPYDQKSAVDKIHYTEIVPKAQASSLTNTSQVTSNNLDVSQIFLVVIGLGILFGAVYLVKRQADNNTRQILLNKNMIRKKILNPILGSSPREIIQTRLAKGEITFEEYDRLKSKLD